MMMVYLYVIGLYAIDVKSFYRCDNDRWEFIMMMWLGDRALCTGVVPLGWGVGFIYSFSSSSCLLLW
jgi:hypothetical protein